MTDKTTKTVTIIGAGIGGLYLIAELGVAGFKLRLHDIDDSKLSEIRARGGVDVEGENGGFAAVERATTDLEPAIDGADVIIVVTGGNSQAVVARSLAPLLRDRQVILLIQGNTGGSLLVRRALDDAGCRAEIDVAEMDNYPYSCWRLSPTRIRPIVRKRWLQIATFPGNRIGEVFPRLSPLFPEAVAAPNSLYTGFANANAMLHVANASTMFVGRRSSRPASSSPTSDGPYQATGTPKSLVHKFITEDAPTGLIPMSALGAAARVGTPAIDALVEIVRSMTGNDFAGEGRTLERLGLSGMDGPEIRRVVESGLT